MRSERMITMSRKLVLALMAAIAAIVSASLTAAATEKLKVAAAFGTIWTSAQPTFCKNRGEFTKADLDVDVLTTRGGSETVQAVITGGADIGYGPGANAVIAASLQGAKIRIVSGYFNGQSDSFFYVPVNSPINGVADLQGKTVAFSRPGSVSEQILLMLKKERNLDFKMVSGGALDAIFTMTMIRQIDVGYSIPPAALGACSSSARPNAKAASHSFQGRRNASLLLQQGCVREQGEARPRPYASLSFNCTEGQNRIGRKTCRKSSPE